MTKDNELSLGRGSEVRRPGRRAGWVLTILSGTFLLALACNPSQVAPTVEVSGAYKQPTPTPVTQYNPDPKIAEIQIGLEEAYEIRPDCFVTDVDIELGNLSAGKDTYTPRPLPANMDLTIRNAVLGYREDYRESLRGGTKDIQKLSSDKYRALYLAYLYDELSSANIALAKSFPQGDERRKELGYLGLCAAVKGMSLTGPGAINEFEQDGSVIPTLPTPSPMRPQA